MTVISFLVLILPPLLVSAVIHEVAHGWVAERLGDPTARSMGRITLNPLKHIDPFMTVLVPSILALFGAPVFAGAKPVPVNPLYFKDPRRGMAYVAFAGPLVNFILSGLCYALFNLYVSFHSYLHLPHIVASILTAWLLYGLLINLVLGLFNLLPIPPLDGGRIAVGFLPLPLAKALSRLERFGIAIVVLLLVSGGVEKILGPVLHFVAAHLT